MQVKLGNHVITATFRNNKGDRKFSIRYTSLDIDVMGIRSNIDKNDIYTNQMHVGIFDIDDRLTLNELSSKILEIQEKFKDFVGNCYIFETSPKKYSFHFYNPATYWDWMKVTHYCSDILDPQYVHWRLFRTTMVMRFTPKKNGYVPKLVRVIPSKYPKYEITAMRKSVLEVLEHENKKVMHNG